MNLIFVDCEAEGPCPSLGRLAEFGAVHYPSRESFHGVIWKTRPSPDNPAIPIIIERADDDARVFKRFSEWITSVSENRAPVFISDNPAYDWQWVNDGFWRHCGRNPFGHSARRIGDFYAGLQGDFSQAQKWKRLRITRHDHNPVHDALGNLEAFDQLLKQSAPAQGR